MSRYETTCTNQQGPQNSWGIEGAWLMVACRVFCTTGSILENRHYFSGKRLLETNVCVPSSRDYAAQSGTCLLHRSMKQVRRNFCIMREPKLCYVCKQGGQSKAWCTHCKFFSKKIATNLSQTRKSHACALNKPGRRHLEI